MGNLIQIQNPSLFWAHNLIQQITDQQNHNFFELSHLYFLKGLQRKMDSGYGATKLQPYDFFVLAIKHTGWRGSKKEWISSKSNLECSKHFYFSILGTKKIVIDCKNKW